MPCSWHPLIRRKLTNARFRRTPIFMGCCAAPAWPMYLRVGCGDRSVHCKTEQHLKQERYHVDQIKWMRAALALTAFSTLAVVALTAAPAEAAVVYCKTAGVPQGCVVRP